MKKYILPFFNCIIISTLAFGLNLRDDTIITGVFFAIMTLVATIYQIYLIKKNGNEIKINAINKIMTILSAILVGGSLYEIFTGQMISDETGDYMALAIIIVGGVILVYDYYIKPLKRK